MAYNKMMKTDLSQERRQTAYQKCYTYQEPSVKTRIMYIEYKGGDELNGICRIGRVRFSKTGKTIYYRDNELQSLKGRGFKSNYYDVHTGEHFWVSGPKKNGQDTLYPEKVFIDEDVREEYWKDIRGIDCALDVIRSEGSTIGWRELQYRR